MLPSVTTVKDQDIWPETAQAKDNKEPTPPEQTVPSVTTVNNLDIWPENAPRNKPPENKDKFNQENATTARRLDTSQETALKAETEERTSSATSATKPVILPEIAKVNFSLIFRLIEDLSFTQMLEGV